MGKKKRVRLDKQAVLQAAVNLVNAEGMAALTLSRLAEELGIQSPSLYNHVDGLPGLQRELAVMNAKQLADRLSAAAIGKSGSELFMATAQAFRNYVKEYPGLYLSCPGYFAHPTGFWGYSEGISSGDSSFPSKLGSVYFMNTRREHLDDRF